MKGGETTLVEIINSPEKLMNKRISRRGYSEKDCKQFLQSRRGDAIILKKRSVRTNSLTDRKDVKVC